MQELFNTHIEKSFPDLKTSKFLLACSGGVDSVVLAHLCAKANLDFDLAHCNFELRGEESDADAIFVNKLGKYLSKKVHVTNFKTDAYSKLNKVSIQISARELRYAWFAKIQSENTIRYLVTAHHADDDLETFLINLSRGSGIEGLKGMPYNTNTLKRPLLQFSRKQILNFAQENKLEWREDKSNAETKYLRNNIRHKIVPLLKQLHPSFLDNFLKSQHYLGQTSAIAKKAVEQIKSQLFFVEGETIKIEIDKLKQLDPLEGYLYSFFKPYGFTEWENVTNLLTAMSGKEIRSKTYRLLKDRDYLLLSPIKEEEKEIYMVLEDDVTITNPLHIQISEVHTLEKPLLKTLYIDKEKIKYPLTLRKWKKGDYFYPFGMQGKKKLAKYFKDEKFNILSKENQWLLCSGDKIVWVVGKRPDNRFKVTEETKHILKFEVKE